MREVTGSTPNVAKVFVFPQVFTWFRKFPDEIVVAETTLRKTIWICIVFLFIFFSNIYIFQ